MHAGAVSAPARFGASCVVLAIALFASACVPEPKDVPEFVTADWTCIPVETYDSVAGVLIHKSGVAIHYDFGGEAGNYARMERNAGPPEPLATPWGELESAEFVDEKSNRFFVVNYGRDDFMRADNYFTLASTLFPTRQSFVDYVAKWLPRIRNAKCH